LSECLEQAPVAAVPSTYVASVGPSCDAAQLRVGGTGERVDASEDAHEMCQAAWTSIPFAKELSVSEAGVPVVVELGGVEVAGASLKHAGLTIPSRSRLFIGHASEYPLDGREGGQVSVPNLPCLTRAIYLRFATISRRDGGGSG